MGVDPSHPLRDASDGEWVIALAATPNELLKPDGCLGSSWLLPASHRRTGLRSRRAKGGWGRAG